MMTKIKAVLEKVAITIKEMFTEADNHTADIACVLFALVVVCYSVCGVYSVFFKGDTFDWQGAGVGIGAILTAAGVMFGCKKQSSGGEE